MKQDFMVSFGQHENGGERWLGDISRIGTNQSMTLMHALFLALWACGNSMGMVWYPYRLVLSPPAYVLLLRSQ